MISPHYFTFPLYVPRVLLLIKNWPLYLFNYLLRRREKAVYEFRDGMKLIDPVGTLAGTIAVVFIRQEYGVLSNLRTILDIGANMGSFAIFAAARCPEARILCYEPVDENFEYLTRNIRVNGVGNRVTAIQSAVAGSGDDRDIFLGHSPKHSLLRATNSEDRRKVRCTTLSEILGTNALDRIDLLKMNCEGAEYEILESCSPSDLARIDRIRLEYHNLDEATRNGPSLCRFLKDRGFTIQRMTQYLQDSGFIWATRSFPGFDGDRSGQPASSAFGLDGPSPRNDLVA